MGYQAGLRAGLILCAINMTSARAAMVFQGNATGSFSNPLAGASDYSKIWNHDAGPAYWYASTFEWGTAGSRRYCVHGQCQAVPLPQAGSSQLAFDGIGSDAGDAGYTAGLGTVFSLGMLKYTNMPTYFSQGVTGVDFTVNVGFRNLAASKPFSFHASIDNTWNGPGNTPDTVAWSDMPAPFDFTSGGQSYRFSVLGFSRNGGASFEHALIVDEGRFVQAGLYGRFDLASAEPVPIPAALWLFGSGFAGIGFALRPAG